MLGRRSMLSTVWRALYSRQVLICILTGFSSGLPLYILITLLPTWLRDVGVNLRTIALFALISLPFTWKFIWSPLFDRYIPPLGRRRGWMLASQVLLLLSLPWFGFLSPHNNIWTIVYLALVVAFLSASQDIAVDAYRREMLSPSRLALGNVVHVNAYKIASLVPGALALILADHMAWHWVFIIMALFMLPGIFTTLCVSEPTLVGTPPKTLRSAVIEPVMEFVERRSFQHALLILGFIFLYKLGDSMATALATPFYLDMGFSKTEIGLVAKNAGLWSSVVGGLLGGLWMLKLGINRALWVFGVVQMLSILGFVWLSISTKSLWLLALVIGAEAFGVGLGTAALVTFIANITHPLYTATQFALFTSLAALPRTFANAATGWLVEHLGWPIFFICCFCLALPGLLLLPKVAPWRS